MHVAKNGVGIVEAVVVLVVEAAVADIAEPTTLLLSALLHFTTPTYHPSPHFHCHSSST